MTYTPSNPDIAQAMRVSQDMKAPIAIVIYLDADCRLHAASYGQNKLLCTMGGKILDASFPTIQTAAHVVVRAMEELMKAHGK